MGRSPREKCRWIAEVVLAELQSSRAPAAMRDHWRGRKLNAQLFEEATAVAGCRAEDAPSVVDPRTDGALGAAIAGPGRWPHDGEPEYTVDYAPSQEALGLLDGLTTGTSNTSTVTEYDGAVASIQSQASNLWDGEVVLVTASIAASSAYYWQEFLGGASGGHGRTSACPTPSVRPKP